jgi:hypothetical protein
MMQWWLCEGDDSGYVKSGLGMEIMQAREGNSDCVSVSR